MRRAQGLSLLLQALAGQLTRERHGLGEVGKNLALARDVLQFSKTLNKLQAHS